MSLMTRRGSDRTVYLLRKKAKMLVDMVQPDHEIDLCDFDLDFGVILASEG